MLFRIQKQAKFSIVRGDKKKTAKSVVIRPSFVDELLG